MSALIDYIQIEIHKTYNKKYSKKYIEDKLIPIINYICSSKSKKFLFGGSQGIGKSSFINIISKRTCLGCATIHCCSKRPFLVQQYIAVVKGPFLCNKPLL